MADKIDQWVGLGSLIGLVVVLVWSHTDQLGLGVDPLTDWTGFIIMALLVTAFTMIILFWAIPRPMESAGLVADFTTRTIVFGIVIFAIFYLIHYWLNDFQILY